VIPFSLRWLVEYLRTDSFDHPPQENWPDYFDNTRDVRNGKGRNRKRDPADVDTIVLHQTAVKFGTTRANREKYGERLALHRRFYKTPYHCIALLNGDVLWNNDVDWYTFHGNSSNATSVGVAVEGSFPGLESKRKPSHHTIDEHVAATVRAALLVTVRKCKEQGSTICLLQAHRNYSAGRRGDPGEQLWRLNAVPLREACHLQTNFIVARGGGRTIPREWDDRARFNYRGRPIDRSSNP
jgi:hypothetical protein